MLVNKTSYIEHINDEDQILPMRRVLDKVEKVANTHSVEYTDFLDPYQRTLCYSFLNRISEINYHTEGGLEGSERKTIIIYPTYLDIDSVENPVGALLIKGKFKFTKVTHRDYLGSIMALGVKREKIGDIAIHESYCYVVVHNEILDYLVYNLKNIGKEPVEVEKVDIDMVEASEEEYRDFVTTVSSLRLDTIISSTHNLSRTISAGYIKGGKVKVNWRPISQISCELKIGDMVSIRGLGRFKLNEILGESRKGKLRVSIRILK